MANTIHIKVDNLSSVLEVYTQIKVYRSATGEDGTFVEITDSSTRLTLSEQDSLYSYTDDSGTTTDYYRATYYNPDTLTESPQSGSIRGTPLTQLVENMQVVVSLDPMISGTNGVSLGE